MSSSALGAVLALRTRQWRLFDWMWGLHIMDLSGREDTSHPVLIASAALALVDFVALLVTFLATLLILAELQLSTIRLMVALFVGHIGATLVEPRQQARHPLLHRVDVPGGDAH